MLNKLRARKNQLHGKGGFTLVELIVVLVILAILAALLIPALTGYIDKANQKKAQAETRMVVMATQTLLSEKYGENKTFVDTGETELTEDTTIKKSEVATLSEVPSGDITTVKVKGKIVSTVTCTVSGKACTYNGTTKAYTFS